MKIFNLKLYKLIDHTCNKYIKKPYLDVFIIILYILTYIFFKLIFYIMKIYDLVLNPSLKFVPAMALSTALLTDNK